MRSLSPLYRGFLIIVLIAGVNQVLTEYAAEPAGESWLQRWREATVAIGDKRLAKISDSAGDMVEKEIFVVVGTGVIFGLPGQTGGVPWLVTAKHVFHDPDKNWTPESVQIRFAWSEDKPVDEDLGITLPIRDKDGPLWIEDKSGKVDLAAIPLKIAAKEAGREKIRGIPIENFAAAEDVFEGARVMVFGYPAAIGLEFWTKALVRGGVIAWVNPRDPLGEPLLIDASILPGSSGGPVFREPSGMNKSGTFEIAGRVAFLGIISKMKLAPIEMPPTTGEKQSVIIGAAIGVVEPASRVRRLLEQAAKRK